MRIERDSPRTAQNETVYCSRLRGGVVAIAPERRARVCELNCGVPVHFKNWGPAGDVTAVGCSAQRATDSASARTSKERRTNIGSPRAVRALDCCGWYRHYWDPSSPIASTGTTRK